MSKSGIRLNNTLRSSALCGIIGPIIYTIVVMTHSFLLPGYSHVTQAISELGAVGAPNAIIMNTAGFPPLGVLMVGFTFGLHRGIGGVNLKHS